MTIGEIDGRTKERTLAVKSIFESAGVPVDLTPDIDGWLKYHVALVSALGFRKSEPFQFKLFNWLQESQSIRRTLMH